MPSRFWLKPKSIFVRSSTRARCWVPIARYPRFPDYGDAADYAARLEAFRVALGEKKRSESLAVAVNVRAFVTGMTHWRFILKGE